MTQIIDTLGIISTPLSLFVLLLWVYFRLWVFPQRRKKMEYVVEQGIKHGISEIKPEYPLKIMLLTREFSIIKDKPFTLVDAMKYEVVAPGYTMGGKTVENLKKRYDYTDEKLYFNYDDVNWKDIDLRQTDASYVLIYEKHERLADCVVIGWRGLADYDGKQGYSGNYVSFPVSMYERLYLEKRLKIR